MSARVGPGRILSMLIFLKFQSRPALPYLIFDWRIRVLFTMVKRIGHGADWGRGVEQLHVGVVGLAGLAVANTVAVVAVERSIVVYKQSPDIGRLA